jgi:uncharacterized damage-inducible protein DinB
MSIAYEWVRRTREVLLAYCEALPPTVYRQVLPAFGAQSIRDLQVHVAETYMVHLGLVAPGEQVIHPDGEDAAATRRLFGEVDALVARFLERCGGRMDQPLTVAPPWRQAPATRSPRWLLTHAVTHEFHHKGQIVKLGRLLGHPVTADTDLALPDELDDLGRLARLTGEAPEAAAAHAVAAALARALAPEIDAAALEQRMRSDMVTRGGISLAAEAAREVEAYPAALQPAIARALAAIGADPGAGQEAAGRRRYGFSALGAEWRVVYLDGDPPRILAVTTRERAGR